MLDVREVSGRGVLPSDETEVERMLIDVHKDNWLSKKQVQFFKDKLFRRRTVVLHDLDEKEKIVG